MSSITIDGTIKSIRTFDDKPFICLDVVTTNTYFPPKGFPEPTQEIEYTVLVSKKQFTRLENELAPFDTPILNSEIHVQGKPTFDLTYDVLVGDLGVIALEVKSMTARKTELDWIEKGIYLQDPLDYPEEIPTSLPLHLIEVPEKAHYPNQDKIAQRLAYYQKHGRFNPSGVTVQWFRGKWVLKRGFSRFAAAKQLGLTEIPVRALMVTVEGLDQDTLKRLYTTK